MELNHDNYYSLEADMAFMSFHQLRNWRTCPAAEQARQAGTWIEEPCDALLVGQYVHCALLEPDKLPAWMEKNGKAICTGKGTLRAEYKVADAMIARLKRDPDAMLLLQGPGGESEKIITWDAEGVTWKGMLDRVYTGHQLIVDLKSARDFEKSWGSSPGWRLPWWKEHDYDAQMSLYSKAMHLLTGEPYTPVIVGVTKQDPPDITGVEFSLGTELDLAYSRAIAGLGEALEIKAGRMPAWRCEKCDFCRSTKLLKITKAW